MSFPDDIVEGNLERPSGNSVGNPLRVQSAPAARSFEPSAANPLRTSSAIPQIADAPVGGGSPPASAISGSAAEQAAAEEMARAFAEQQRALAAAREAMMRETEAKAMAEQSSRKASAPKEEAFDVVQVFYGTDRQVSDGTENSWSALAVRLLPTGFGALLTLSLVLVASGRRSLVLWLVAFVGAGTSLGLAWQAAAKTLAAVRHTGKEGPQYTTARASGGNIDVGLCEVTVPKTHEVGQLEAPSILRLEVKENAARHVVLRKTERLASEPFYDLLRQHVEASPRKELFIFVHGFNVSFEEAARRTAQIHYDMNFAGAPIFFSWPAHDKFIITYPADETNVSWSAPHLKRFLLEVVKESQARSINLIAHSMGSRALAAALREIELEMRGQSRLFNQVILAAPDIDAEEFRIHLAPAIARASQRLTLYASSRDDALLASQFLHRSPRAGDARDGLVVVSGIDTIDVTAIDSSPWGHTYLGSNDPILQDLKLLFSDAAAPRDRSWLSPAERGGLTYWVFQPTRTATAGAVAPR
jgi:esterase/lipase superfamily enzyme